MSIIPVAGPKEPDDFQPVLDIIADELNFLYQDGLLVQDSANPGQPQHRTRVKLFGLVADYKAIGPLLRGRRSMAHHHSCYKCHQEGISIDGKPSIFPGKFVVTCM